MATTSQQNKVLDALLARLYASLARGPALNSNPGNSRQRVDLVTLARIGASPSSLLAGLLGEAKSHRIRFDKQAPPKASEGGESEEGRRVRREYDDGHKLLRKLSALAREADTYQRDTGAAALYIGYPLLSFPEAAARGAFGASRLLAPLAFVPVTLEVATGSRPGLKIESAAVSGSERVIANVALKTWIERQAGIKYPDLFDDEEGADPLREIAELMAHVAETLGIKQAPSLGGWPVERVPETKALGDQAALLPCAVLGLFPLSKQGAIRDTEDLKERGDLPETVRPFVTLEETLSAKAEDAYRGAEGPAVALLPASEEHLVDWADPCQRRAVIRARTTKGLVVHGPPGTGKSQTITNIIGDFLARKKKVLLVCEKRTALDVVKYRLEARGLGPLCAVVHDATSDRTALYTGIREQLDALADGAALPDPARELDRVNSEIDAVSRELRDYDAAMGEADPETGATFHALMGEWLCSAEEAAFAPPKLDAGLAGVSPELLRSHEGVLRSAYRRVIGSSLADNGWDSLHQLTLDTFLARRMDDLRRGMDDCVQRAREARATANASLPPLRADVPLDVQAEWRESAALELARLTAGVASDLREGAALLSPDAAADAVASFSTLEAPRAVIASAPLAADLAQAFNTAPWPPQQVLAGIPPLATYLAKVQGFLGFFQFGVKKAAAALLAPLGLSLDRANAGKAKQFLEGVHARNVLGMWLKDRMPKGFEPARLDPALLRQASDLHDCASLLVRADREPAGSRFGALLREALGSGGDSLAQAMQRSAKGIRCVRDTLSAMASTELFRGEALAAFSDKLLFGKPIDEDLAKLREDLERMEPLLRFEAEVSPFPPAVGDSLRLLAREDMPEEVAWRRLLAGSYAGALERRLREHPVLLRHDATRLEGNFARLRELSAQKMQLEAARISHLWRAHQRARLLASTGTRLNSNGADLRRRLMLRGKQASRIRQVIQEGRALPDGDPLFDIHPIWMTSPETASTIFPAEAVFDAVIFDEASQCRLEEGLPVLLRGTNVVIAGDTRQLPPTRFFESALVSSDAGAEEEAGQEELFQSQQSEIEDLLSASLNIEIEQAYLDVHYRSVNEDLIRFSNESFYGSRLQAIPGHPNAVDRVPPIRLHRVDGAYIERQNPAEADFIVSRVRELLAQENAPSIGIVSFNLTQKDLIDEKLDEAADNDPEFRSLLEGARSRERGGAFEGLFVKNLENVQGDERDVILISTTYGPTPEGRFYRRFGPLGRAGGERRLNVIVTRARHRVEIATSIPSSVYRADANTVIPAGMRPNGACYLMRYLRDAEAMEETYSKLPPAPESPGVGEPAPVPVCLSGGSGAPSLFAESFATILLERHGIGSTLYHGNDGFCVDLAFHHPRRANEVTIGVQFDGPRYPRAQDRVEWDAFRRTILEGQNWELHRVWTPHFLRDPEGTVRRLVAAAERYAKEERWELHRARQA